MLFLPDAVMALSLPQSLYFARCNQSYVFLDLSKGRYFLLRAATADSFARFLGNNAASTDILLLRQCGLIVDSLHRRPIPEVTLERPCSSLVDEQPERASIRLVVQALIAQMRASRAIERGPLAAIMEMAAPGSCSRPASDLATCRRVAAAFQLARRYRSATDQCLVRGLAMKQILERKGCAASLVLGVKLPFSAHCWVQTEGVVLTDPLDRVRIFTPLLVV